MVRRLVPALLMLMVCAAPAQAGSVTIGSNLKAKAKRKQATPVDSVYWNTKLASGRRVRSPARGQVVRMRLKGRVIPHGAKPDVVMNLQTLTPNGTTTPAPHLTAGPFDFPFGGRRNRITSYNVKPRGMCVEKGEFLGLATSGGFGPNYPNGAEFAMFAAVGGSAFGQYTTPQPDNAYGFKAHRGGELLMQIKIATGKDAGFCR